MNSGFLDVSMAPKTNIIYLWRHQDTSNNSRINPKAFFGKFEFGKSQNSGNPFFENIGKTGTEQSRRAVKQILEKLKNDINIPQLT